jgi:two-component system, OmpR family, phosphate regulon sensor histidine kinase PhoR
MTTKPVKPWSQLDDDVASTRVSTESAASRTLAPPRRKSPIARFLDPRILARFKVSPMWSMAPVAVAAIWILATILAGNGGGVAWHAMGWIGCLGASAVILVLSSKARQAALAGLRQAVRSDQQHRPVSLVDSPPGTELGDVWNAVESHSANIGRRLEELMDERRGLALQLSLAETRKRQAESIISSLAEPVLVTDAFDQLVMANPAAEELFGFTCASAMRKPISEVLPDGKLVATICHAREADSRVARRRAEQEIGDRLFAVAISPVAGEGSNESETASRHGVVAILRDITKDRQASKNKSEFVAHVAHELRTPLASIRAYVEMLVDGEAADEKTRKEYYETIQSSAQRLARLIDNMLNISRIEAGTVRINREPVAIAMIVKEATDMLRPQAEEKGIALTEELTPVVYRVLADRDLIHEAIVNLLSNAIKYTPSGGVVSLRMTPEEQTRRIRIEVSDTGAGIPPEDLPRMFEKFFRVEANKKLAKGTGLGLSLVKQIVETVHNGEMTLTSEVGKGSTFGMVLPLA